LDLDDVRFLDREDVDFAFLDFEFVDLGDFDDIKQN